MNSSKLQSLLGIATAFGAANMMGQAREYRSEVSNKSDFAKWNNEMKQLCEPRLFYRSSRPYTRPLPKLHKGKKAVRAAKRANVKMLKARTGTATVTTAAANLSGNGEAT